MGYTPAKVAMRALADTLRVSFSFLCFLYEVLEFFYGHSWQYSGFVIGLEREDDEEGKMQFDERQIL